MEETGRNGAEMERTLVWGHRGASGYAPENTMAAFEKAVELGVYEVIPVATHRAVVKLDEKPAGKGPSEIWLLFP